MNASEIILNEHVTFSYSSDAAFFSMRFVSVHVVVWTQLQLERNFVLFYRINKRQIQRILFEEVEVSVAFYRPLLFVTFTTSAKASETNEMCFTLPKYCKNFTHSCRFVEYCQKKVIPDPERETKKCKRESEEVVWQLHVWLEVHIFNRPSPRYDTKLPPVSRLQSWSLGIQSIPSLP